MKAEDWNRRRRARRSKQEVEPITFSELQKVDATALHAPPQAAAGARAVVGSLAPGGAVFALTDGTWSLIDLIRAILAVTGPAHVQLAVWTAGIRDAEVMAWLLHTGEMLSFRAVVNAGWPDTDPESCAQVVQAWGNEAIVVTENHAKIATIRNGAFSVALSGSMNLNRNARYESAVWGNLPAVADCYDRWFAAVRAEGHTLDTPQPVVRAAFSAAAALLLPPRPPPPPETDKQRRMREFRERKEAKMAARH